MNILRNLGNSILRSGVSKTYLVFFLYSKMFRMFHNKLHYKPFGNFANCLVFVSLKVKTNLKISFNFENYKINLQYNVSRGLCSLRFTWSFEWSQKFYIQTKGKKGFILFLSKFKNFKLILIDFATKILKITVVSSLWT